MPKHRVIMDSQVLTTCMACERLLDLRFNHHLIPIGGPGESIEKGLMVHYMLESFYRGQMEGLKYSDRIAKGIAAGQLFIHGDQNNSEKFPGLRSISHDDAHYVMESFQQYAERWKNDSWITVNVETVKKGIIYEDDTLSLMWKAKVDWEVDTASAIIPADHKTMKRQQETLSLNNQFMGQCVIQQVNQIVINKFGFQKTLKPEEKFIRVGISYSKDQLAEWIQTAVYYAYKIIELAEDGYYPPRFIFCDKYNGCLFKKACQAIPNDRERVLMEHFKVGEPWDIGQEDE